MENNNNKTVLYAASAVVLCGLLYTVFGLSPISTNTSSDQQANIINSVASRTANNPTSQ